MFTSGSASCFWTIWVSGCLVDQVGGQIGCADRPGVSAVAVVPLRGWTMPGDVQFLTAVHEISHEIDVGTLIGPDIVGRSNA